MYLLRRAVSQSINELKTGGKTLDNPNDLFVRLDKKNSLKLLFQPFTRVRLERPNTLGAAPDTALKTLIT